jgi:hypothetical protein
MGWSGFGLAAPFFVSNSLTLFSDVIFKRYLRGFEQKKEEGGYDSLTLFFKGTLPSRLPNSRHKKRQPVRLAPTARPKYSSVNI